MRNNYHQGELMVLNLNLADICRLQKFQSQNPRKEGHKRSLNCSFTLCAVSKGRITETTSARKIWFGNPLDEANKVEC
jgi:hypothetical protein